MATGDLAVRTAAGLALAGVALAALWVGGALFWALASAAALLMLAEWSALARVPRLRMLAPLGITALVLVYAVLMQATGPALPSLVAASWGAAAAAALLGALLAVSVRMGWGMLYALLPALGLVALRGRPDGVWMTLWTLAIVWATDIGAYFAGRLIGGPKLMPAVSPAKTWAGLGGGVALAALVGWAIARRCDLPAACLWLAAPLALVAQAGDLFESALKRRAGVKDSGRLIPGHGGALDRLDGLVPVAVLVAALAAKGVL